MAIKRQCSLCEKPGGKGPRELRPYGKGGSDVCAECTFSGPDAVKNQKIAREQFNKQIMTMEPLVLNYDEQVGPRPIIPRKA